MELELDIKGMTCASCVRHVEKALASVSGVEAASVNLATNRARVSSQAAVSTPALIKAVEDAGYEALPLSEIPKKKV